MRDTDEDNKRKEITNTQVRMKESKKANTSNVTIEELDKVLKSFEELRIDALLDSMPNDSALICSASEESSIKNEEIKDRLENNSNGLDNTQKIVALHETIDTLKYQNTLNLEQLKAYINGKELWMRKVKEYKE